MDSGTQRPGRARPAQRAEPRSVATVLRVAVVGAVALVALVAVGAVVALGATSDGIDEVTQSIEPTLDANAALLQTMTDAESGERGFIATGDERFLEAYDDALADLPDLDQALRAAAVDDAELDQLLDAQEDARNVWIEEFAEEVIATARDDRVAASRRAATGEGRRRFIALRIANDAVEAHLVGERTAALDRIDRTERRVRMATLGTIGMGVVAAFALAAFGHRQVVEPLDELNRALERIRDGDHEIVVARRGPRELRALADAVDEVARAAGTAAVEAGHREAHHRRTNRLSGAVRATLDTDEICRIAAREVCELLDAAAVDVVLDAVTPARRVRWPDPLTEEHGWAAGLEPALVRDLEEAGVVHEVGDTDAPAWAASAVLLGDRRVGAIVVADASARAWDSYDLQLLQVAGREVGAAIEHARLLEEEREVVADLHALDAARSEFVSSVSHELRTPLASIIGYTEMLLDGDAGEVAPPQRSMLDAVERNARRLLSLVEDLLIVARIEAGRFELEVGPVDVVRVIEAAVDSVDATSRRRALALTMENAPDLPTITGDARHLERVVLNLLSNAIKFTPDDGSVRVTARPDGDGVAIEVADTGLGIPEAEQATIFERFARSSISRRRAVQGTGLGLAIVRTIVEAHDGTVEVRSTEGEGTTFTVRLPRHPAPTAHRQEDS
ncbi:sensor histidine kinase [Actinomarinicola tropica]|uniref:histidine kinase n=1 Tax=Actinomarinicola tropica TaxID=2789776 RepID=A0A5Q2RGC9_9ACTN|nr:ATP-binding protein [Actinomarinicola tropica]QGG94694.1 HAMP domain-containing protein [Actinomarinicola tropica]